jgi:hypothetical protein
MYSRQGAENLLEVGSVCHTGLHWHVSRARSGSRSGRGALGKSQREERKGSESELHFVLVLGIEDEYKKVMGEVLIFR